MGLFTPKVPNTISDKERERLNRRGARNGESWLGKKSADRRKASERQRKRSAWS